MLKTCAAAEARLLLRLLPSYYEHVARSAAAAAEAAAEAAGAGDAAAGRARRAPPPPATLLPRYYGLYRIRRGAAETCDTDSKRCPSRRDRTRALPAVCV